MSESKFKVGDELRVLDKRNLKWNARYQPYDESTIEEFIVPHIGKVLTVIGIDCIGDSTLYRLAEKDNKEIIVCILHENWLELVEPSAETFAEGAKSLASKFGVSIEPSEHTLAYVKVENETAEFKVMGFDPENLTFDGEEIKAKDSIIIPKQGMFEVVTNGSDLGIRIQHGHFVYLQALNIISHVSSTPKKDEELERLELALKEAHQAASLALQRECVASQALEDYKSKNNIL